MEYLGRRPAPPLADAVERVWHLSGVLPADSVRLLPGGGTLDLVFDLGGAGGPVVRGPVTRATTLVAEQPVTLVGAHVRPGGALSFLPVSPRDLVDRQVGLDELWGSCASTLRDRLAELPDPERRLDLLEAILFDRLSRARVGHRAVTAALPMLDSPLRPPRMRDVAAEVGLSQRRFIELFGREVGITPKRYARLRRFHRAKSSLATTTGVSSWARFAVGHGYFDQSHVIRDFVEFTGLTPTQHLRARTGETALDRLVHAYREPAVTS